MTTEDLAETIASYDRVAPGYANFYFPKLVMKEHLDTFLSNLPRFGDVIDMGCGPGQDAAYMVQMGRNVVGADLSVGMLEEARRRVPKAAFVKHDMRHPWPLARPVAGIWSCAAIVHLQREELPGVLHGFHRTLVKGGLLYLSAMRGEGCERKTEQRPFGLLSRFFTYFELHEISSIAVDNGFSIEVSEAKGRWLWVLARVAPSLVVLGPDANERQEGSSYIWVRAMSLLPGSPSAPYSFRFFSSDLAARGVTQGAQF